MGDTPRELLVKLIREQGTSIIFDPVKFRNLLVDYSKGEYRKERKCLSDALSEDIPGTLLAKKDQLVYATISQQLSHKLIQELGINPELSKWTVDSWAIALGIIRDVDLLPQEFNLSILSNPPGARVSLNGTLKGVTPLTLNNPELNTYHVQILRDSYEPWTLTQLLTSRVNLTITANLIKKSVESGSITIETYPSNAEIYLNSKKQGKTPKTIQNLSEAYYEIKLALPGYNDIVLHRQVLFGINTKIRETFSGQSIPKPKNKTGKITIDSSPSAAEVYLDNRVVGNTPLVLYDVPSGNHTISLSLSSYLDVKKQIYVKSGQTVSVFETLAQISTPPFTKAIYAFGLLLLIFFLAVFFYGGNSSTPPAQQYSQQTPIITTIPDNTIVEKDLAIRSYGDYLQQGQTNTYYFDLTEADSKNNLLKVIVLGKSGNKVSSAVGINYVPSMENKKFDYVSVTGTDAVIEIKNPKPGRYFVTVKGVIGSGDTRVSRSFY